MTTAFYHGDKTEAVCLAIETLLRPGDTFEVCDLAVLIKDHPAFFSIPLSHDEVNKLVYTLAKRGDDCLEHLGRGRYQFNGFHQSIQRGRLRGGRCTVQRGTCQACFLQLPTSGVCDCGHVAAL